MPYIYTEVEKLLNVPLVGSGTCVDLIKQLVPGLIGKPTAAWRAGANVIDTFRAGRSLPQGTAIATFEKGRYVQSCPVNYEGSCHHAALLLRTLPGGIWVMDQYTGVANRQFVSRRFIRIPVPREQRLADGSYRNAGNNALAFAVIER
jgi:hypothetical protein